MILFVDDEKRYVRNYIEELEFAEFNVEYINNTEDALHYIESKKGEKIRLLVLDVMIPTGKITLNENYDEGLHAGIEFYKKFRESYTDKKVFILTNVTREKVREFFEGEDNCFFNRKSEVMPTEFAKLIKNQLKTKD